MTYQSFVLAMAALPCDAEGMAAAAGITRNRMYHLAPQMRRLGLIRVIGKERTGKIQRVIYGIGDGTPDLTVKCRFSSLAFQLALVWREMAEPVQTKSVAETTGVNWRVVHSIVRYLRKAGIAHIGGWEWSGTAPVAEFQRGRGRDAKRPAPMSRSEQNRRYRQACKARSLAAHVMGMAA